jgi:hypothetical protein
MAEQNWKEQKSSFFAASLAPLLWTLVFFVLPMGIVWAYSFGRNAGLTEIDLVGTLDNYKRATEWLYLTIFAKSLGVAALVTLICLVVGFPVAMAITAVATFGAEAIGWLNLDLVANVHQVDFIYQVGPVSLIVALLAGAAGMLSLVSSKSGALIGVFISVTTVPAAGFAVVAAVLGDWSVAGRSALQLMVNLVGIVIAGVAVLLLQRS